MAAWQKDNIRERKKRPRSLRFFYKKEAENKDLA
jgi:hypothetical protein